MHDCTHDCKHENVKYCAKCKTVYCVDCRREWFDKCQLNHYVSYPYYTIPCSAIDPIYYTITTAGDIQTDIPAGSFICVH